MTTKRIPLLVAVLIAFALGAGALTACGGDEAKTTTTQTTAASTGTNKEEVVVASNGDFNPAEIYERDAPSVVTVISVFGGGANVLDPTGSQGGQGSGFLVSENGEVLTNAHVVTQGGPANGGGRFREAEQVYVEFADRNRVGAKIVGYDPHADVALLKVDGDAPDPDPLTLSEGKGISVGSPVAAIGSPFGAEQSLSVGVISATDRSIQSLTDFRIDGAIQTDASINPGNSGGPLLNAKGEVIGINQQIQSASGSDSGVGFAVPVEAVRYALDQLREGGKVEYAFIGVSTQALWPQLAGELDIDSDNGALIAEVVKGGPAAEAGLRGGDDERRFQGARIRTGGDVIIAIDGEKLVQESDIATIISRHRPGDKVTLEIIRDGERKEIDVELAPRPDNPPG